MNIKLIIEQVVQIREKKYWVIGIENYMLDNFLDQKRSWTSYILKNSFGENAWVSKADDEDYFIQWRAISQSEFQNKATMALNLELSGMAHLSFIGERTHNTPLAETLYFNIENQNYDFLATERYLESENQKLFVWKSLYMTGKKLEIVSISPHVFLDYRNNESW